MEPLDLLNSHRSIRLYKSDPVREEALAAILHAASRASSSGNMQTYSIIVTKDAERRAALWELHYEQDMIKQAPVLLTFCVDWNRMVHWCESSDASPGYDNVLSFLVGFADALIAAQNAAVAAESLGLGICYMGTTICIPHKLIDFFKLPRRVFPATTLVLGHPEEAPDLRARLPLESIVHRESYAPFDDARIKATYHDRETEGWDRYMAIPELAEHIHQSGVRNLAQVYTQLKYTLENNTRLSRDLVTALRRQGFLDNHPDLFGALESPAT
ncbi:MAG: nitroreductase family protein [Phycisphaerales bacterium JB038]